MVYLSWEKISFYRTELLMDGAKVLYELLRLMLLDILRAASGGTFIAIIKPVYWRQ